MKTKKKKKREKGKGKEKETQEPTKKREGKKKREKKRKTSAPWWRRSLARSASPAAHAVHNCRFSACFFERGEEEVEKVRFLLQKSIF